MKIQKANKNYLYGTVKSKYGRSVCVEITRLVKHLKYLKYIKKSHKIITHDEKELSKIGDKVEIIEAKPFSKRKSWKISKILS